MNLFAVAVISDYGKCCFVLCDDRSKAAPCFHRGWKFRAVERVVAGFGLSLVTSITSLNLR